MKDRKQLTERQQTTLIYLAYYRGCTAIQLTNLAYDSTEITKSNKTNIYRQLQFLEDEKLVTREVPDPKISKFATYELTRAGLEFMNQAFGLEVGIEATGWIFENGEIDFGHFTYDVYEPPKTQLQHFSMAVDILIILRLNRIKHRNNLYAKHELTTGHMSSDRYILRPDAEMEINGQIYTIEIDRATESHAKLVEKFKNYFKYCGAHNQHKGYYDLHNIVFIVKSEDNGRLRRRWNNILAAYYIAMRGLHDRFNLYLVTDDEFEKFVKVERDRDELCAQLLTKTYGKDYSCVYAESGAMYKATLKYQHTGEEFDVNYQVLSTAYSSKNLQMAKIMQVTKGINRNILAMDYPHLYLSNELNLYDVPTEIVDLYKMLRLNTTMVYL